MLSAVVLTLLFGSVLGGVWGLACGFMRKNSILADQDPMTQLLRNAIGGIVGFVVASFLLGSAPFHLAAVLFGIVISIITENWFVQR